MGVITAKGSLIVKALEDFKDLPTRAIARRLHELHPLDFPNIEDCRKKILYYTTPSGKNGRGTQRQMPQPTSIEREPFYLPTKNNNIGVISDLHIPNHRTVPINIAIEIFKKQKINTLIINGDLLDNTPFTKHDGKRPTPGQVREWFDMTEAFLEFLRSTFPKVDIYWLEGNHDFWYKRWMQKNAEQLDEDPYFSLQSRLHIQDYNIIFLPQETYMKAGKLNILHGHQLSGRFGVGVSPARSIYLKTKKSTLIGHVHVEDSYTDNDIDRTTTTCWSTGCLCTLTPDYNPIGGKACHGFAHVIIESTGDFSVKNYRISKGKLL